MTIDGGELPKPSQPDSNQISYDEKVAQRKAELERKYGPRDVKQDIETNDLSSRHAHEARLSKNTDMQSVEVQLRPAVGRYCQYRDGNFVLQGKIKGFDIDFWGNTNTKILTLYAESVEGLHYSGEPYTREPETEDEKLKGVLMFGVNTGTERININTNPDTSAINFDIGGFTGTIFPEDQIVPTLSSGIDKTEKPRNSIKSKIRHIFRRK